MNGSSAAAGTSSVWWRLLLFVLLSIAGLAAHLAKHPVQLSFYNWWGPGFNTLNILVIPLLFLRRSTAGWAFVLACLTVAAGTLGMAHNALLTIKDSGGLPFSEVLTRTPILFALLLPAFKLPLSYAIYSRQRPAQTEGRRGCRS